MTDKPVTQSEDFVAEFHTMDLSELKDKTFLVTVSTGDRNKGRFLSTTVRGPYSFAEMCEEVGVMWEQQNHHAKAVICEKDRSKPIKTLDEGTIDYIEAHYQDIVVNSMLEDILTQSEFTCKAGVVEADMSEEPAKVTHVVEENEDEV